jgi:MoaA/NifB/PqqE/SkfB family radical SAM enzyme
MWGREYIHRSAYSVLSEIQELISTYNIDYLLFRDEDFTTCRLFVVRLCEEMIRHNIRLSWNCIARVDEVDSELLGLMKQAGCFEIAFGLESGDDSTLGEIGKGYDTKTAVANLWKVHEAGIKTGCLFMIGFPWDNVKTLETTREFITKIPYDRLRIAFATPFPGTAFWHTCLASDSILTRDYARYTTDEPIFKLQGLSSDDLMSFRDKELGTRMYFCEVYRKRTVDAITREPHLFDSYLEWFQFLCRLLPGAPSLSKWWHEVVNDLPYSILQAATPEIQSLASIGKGAGRSAQTLVRCDAKKVDRSDRQANIRIEIERGRKPAPPPRIVGAISTAEVKAARPSGQMLQLSLMFGSVCNLRCVYCFTDAAGAKMGELEWEEIEHIVRQFKDLGGKTVIVPGAGEPTLSPHLGPLARLGRELGLAGIIYTNGFCLDRSLASLLYDCGWSIFVKFNSLDPKVQNRLAGDTMGMYARCRNRALAMLMDMGFNNKLPAPAVSRLGIVTSIMEANKNEILDIFRFARNHNLVPSMDNLLGTGRARGCGLGLAEAECDRIVLELKRTDEKEYGYSWNPHSFAVAGDCLSLYVGLCVHATGQVSPCLGTEIEIGDVRTQTLREIWESDPGSCFRNIDRHIKGPCRTCSIHVESLCYGCVGRRLQSLAPQEMRSWDSVTDTAFHTVRCPAYRKDRREHSCQIEVQAG